MKKMSLMLLLVGGSFLTATVAQAAPVIYNDTIPNGTAAFDATVTSVGGIVKTDTLSGLSSDSSWVRSGYKISSTDNSTRFIDNTYLAGDSIGINPSAPAELSGLTFTFNTGVNAFGLEIGDWATCCYPSSLFISFDGGATRKVATAVTSTDNPGFDKLGVYENFVGAIDTSNTFTKVTFYGDGFGEYLVAGGTIRYSTLDIGSVPTTVPEPETYAMFLVGLGLLGYASRRKQS